IETGRAIKAKVVNRAIARVPSRPKIPKEALRFQDRKRSLMEPRKRKSVRSKGGIRTGSPMLLKEWKLTHRRHHRPRHLDVFRETSPPSAYWKPTACARDTYGLYDG